MDLKEKQKRMNQYLVNKNKGTNKSIKELQKTLEGKLNNELAMAKTLEAIRDSLIELSSRVSSKDPKKEPSNS